MAEKEVQATAKAAPDMPERFNKLLRSVVKPRTPAELKRLMRVPK